MTVDEILAGGRYRDRQGREWICAIRWFSGDSTWYAADDVFKRERDMRLLIERDMHRDECVGLWDCETHPVHFVLSFDFDRARYVVYRPHEYDGELDQFGVLSDAMDAANEWALEVGE